LRLKLDLARHHVPVLYPFWLFELEERLFRNEQQLLGASSPTLMTLKRARQYESFLTSLWGSCVEKFGGSLTETMLGDELDALRAALDGERRDNALRERLKVLVEQTRVGEASLV
jgi:hypothetical protein